MVYNWPFSLQPFWPSRCLLCADTGHDGLDLCAACLGELPVNPAPCPVCALPLDPVTPSGIPCGHCRFEPPPYRRIRAPYLYAAPLDRLIAAFKFRGNLAAGRLLGELLVRAVAHHPLPDLILPVPLHADRLVERGILYAPDYVINAAPQSGLDRATRQRNIAGAFSWQGQRPAPARVALVDDVVTTGSTAAAAARTVLRAGAEHVEIWALARTPEGR